MKWNLRLFGFQNQSYAGDNNYTEAVILNSGNEERYVFHRHVEEHEKTPMLKKVKNFKIESSKKEFEDTWKDFLSLMYRNDWQETECNASNFCGYPITFETYEKLLKNREEIRK